MITLLDLKKTEAGIGHELVEEAVVVAPELRLISADYIVGNTMTLEVRTALPTVAFRRFNEGAATGADSTENKTFECATLDHLIEVDQAMIDAFAPAVKARKLESRSLGAIQAAFQHVGKQFYYGNASSGGNDTKGFPGLIAQMKADSSHEVDAGGSSVKSSVFLVMNGPDLCEFLFANNRTITFDEEWVKGTATDDNGGKFPVYQNWMRGSVGLRLANRNACIRIKNIGTATGKTLTGDMMASALGKLDDLGMPRANAMFFMNGRSREQLRLSRKTDLNPDPAMPKDYEGVPIVHTASINSAETI